MPTTTASPTQPKETYRARLHQQFVTRHGSKRGVAAGEYFVPPGEREWFDELVDRGMYTLYLEYRDTGVTKPLDGLLARWARNS